jgi:hypothetical protein
MRNSEPVIGICIARTETSTDLVDVLFDVIEYLEYGDDNGIDPDDLDNLDESLFQNRDGVSQFNLVKLFFKWAESTGNDITIRSFTTVNGEQAFGFIHNEFNYNTDLIPWCDHDCYTLTVADLNTIIEITKVYDEFCRTTMNRTLYEHFANLGNIGLHYVAN